MSMMWWPAALLKISDKIYCLSKLVIHRYQRSSSFHTYRCIEVHFGFKVDLLGNGLAAKNTVKLLSSRYFRERLKGLMVIEFLGTMTIFY